MENEANINRRKFLRLTSSALASLALSGCVSRGSASRTSEPRVQRPTEARALQAISTSRPFETPTQTTATRRVVANATNSPTEIRVPRPTNTIPVTATSKPTETSRATRTPTPTETQIATPTKATIPTKTPTLAPTETNIPPRTATPVPTAISTSRTTEIPRAINTSIPQSGSGEFCAQIITRGQNIITREVKDFPNSCLPLGWTRVDSPIPTSTAGPIKIQPPTSSTPQIVPSPDATGKPCGGIAANLPERQCPDGYYCQLDSKHPDAGGVCVKKPLFPIPIPQIKIPPLPTFTSK